MDERIPVAVEDPGTEAELLEQEEMWRDHFEEVARRADLLAKEPLREAVMGTYNLIHDVVRQDGESVSAGLFVVETPGNDREREHLYREVEADSEAFALLSGQATIQYTQAELDRTLKVAQELSKLYPGLTFELCYTIDVPNLTLYPDVFLFRVVYVHNGEVQVAGARVEFDEPSFS